MPKPYIFIASSSEGKEVAEAIQQNLWSEFETEIWSQGIFNAGEYILEGLIKKVGNSDFAIMALTSDDIVSTRGKEYDIPRDNVLFELGMFIGKLGRDRTFMVVDKRANLKLPSDLDGIITCSYEPPERGGYQGALGPACSQIKKQIKELGSLGNHNCFPKDLEIIEDVGLVLQNQVMPIIKEIAAEGGKIEIENLGLDLENVMIWMKDRINKGEFKGISLSFKSLIINPESPDLKGLIDGGSNISSESVNFSISSAKKLTNNERLNNFELQMRQYNLPPIIHGFIINNKHLFLGYTEIEGSKLMGGLKPYIYLNKQEHNSSLIALHYFACFRSWFDYYWNISTPVVDVKK